MARCGMMRTAASETGVWLVIDCYPLAHLNTTFHLYDEQLNFIQALVLCRLFDQHVLERRFILHSSMLVFDFSFFPLFSCSDLLLLNSRQINGQGANAKQGPLTGIQWGRCSFQLFVPWCFLFFKKLLSTCDMA